MFIIPCLHQVFKILPWFHRMFVEPIYELGITFNNEANIRSVRCPVLFLHAEDDTVVPFWLGKKV